MPTVTLNEAPDQLQELTEAALKGETVIIVVDEQHAIRLTPVPSRRGRKAGTARGKIVVRDDFDDPLPDFETYA